MIFVEKIVNDFSNPEFGAVQKCAKYRKILKKCVLAKVGFDAAEKEPFEVC